MRQSVAGRLLVVGARRGAAPGPNVSFLARTSYRRLLPGAGTVTALTTLTKVGRQAVAAHDAQFDLPADHVARLSVDLVARLSEHQPVLDAGCGSGLMLVPLRGAGLDVVGVDIDTDMVGAALNREPNLRGRLAFADLAALAVRRSGFGRSMPPTSFTSSTTPGPSSTSCCALPGRGDGW